MKLSFACCWSIVLLASLVCSPLVYGAGFRITNQSAAAVGLAGAHVAYTPGPDAAYSNPANMALLAEEGQIEVDLTTLHLPSITYQDDRSPLFAGSADEEWFVFPLLHAVSPKWSDFRCGFSLIYPFGLVKQWEQAYPRMFARKFSLLTVEANPSVSYTPAEWLTVAAGVRFIYGMGEMENLVTNPPAAQLGGLSSIRRNQDGDAWEYGYNLAVTVVPLEPLHLSATFRSEVILHFEGEAELSAAVDSGPVQQLWGRGELDVPLPAVLSFAASWQVAPWTFEFVWDRTFWSAVDSLDSEYAGDSVSPLFNGLYMPIAKNWEDSDAFRFGLWYQWTPRFCTTVGLAFEQTPVPESTLGFELPDADAVVYAAGLQYAVTRQLNMTFSYMYHHTKSRSVENDGYAGLTGIDGSFTEGGAHAVTIGLRYVF